MHTDVNLAGHMHGVQAFFFKDDRDSKIFELANIVQAVNGVSGEAGNRFRQHHVNLLLTA